MLSPSSSASNVSPGRSPSFARNRLGNTTCPLVEILVSMVRQSYLPDTAENNLNPPQGCNQTDILLAAQRVVFRPVFSSSLRPSTRHSHPLYKIPVTKPYKNE
jgi:hypothetical protein